MVWERTRKYTPFVSVIDDQILYHLKRKKFVDRWEDEQRMNLVDKLCTSIYDFVYRRHEHVGLDHELKFDEADLIPEENERGLRGRNNNPTENHVINFLPWIMVVISI